MDFSFDVPRVLRENVSVWDRQSLLQATKQNAPLIKEIVDRMGLASSKAQGLKTAVTSYNVLLQSPDQRLYIFSEGRAVIGIIKVGRKKLFIRSELDMHREITPISVLDFYVHESMQRTGKGKLLFEAMMERENIQPWKLAYDRPSTKFMNFLRKHYGLADFTPQANNFVVFKRYFEDSRSSSRNEQPNASVSMRPLTANQKAQRRNSLDGSQMKSREQTPTPTGAYYTPQKPMSRPESVTPLALNQLPKNGYNPYSLQNSRTIPPSLPSSKPAPEYNDYNDNEANYNDDEHNSEREYQHDNEDTHHGNGNGYNDEHNEQQYDDNIASEDYNDRPRHNDTYEAQFTSTTTARHTPFATTSSNYGSHSPAFKRPSSPSRKPPANGPLISSGSIHSDNSTFHRANTYNPSMNLHGNGIFGISTGATPDTPPRGRSPARRSESPYAETASPTMSRTSNYQRTESPYATTSSPSSNRQRSNSLDRTHVPPKGLGTMGNFNQSFNYPVKYEKDLAAPPQQAVGYKDSSIFPARRETQPQRSPTYRLNAASRLNSREMDHLESSMRSALTTIDSHEKRVNLINDGGYRAISPEPRAPTRTDSYQSPQSRSIFSTVQPTGSPVQRSVSPPTRVSSMNSNDSNFSKSDFHRQFHDANPNLMSQVPTNVRVHPNSRSRQSAFPS